MFSATSLASISGLRISTMFSADLAPVILARSLRSFSMSAPFLPMTTPGRAAWMRDARLLRRPLDHHAATRRPARGASCRILAQLQVLVQQLGVVVVGEPAAVPGAVDAEPEPDRIDFLTHVTRSPAALRRCSRTTMVRWLNDFSIARRAAAAAGVEALHHECDRPTVASATTSRSTSSWWLFSALAIAALQHLLHRRRRCGACEKVSSATRRLRRACRGSARRRGSACAG